MIRSRRSARSFLPTPLPLGEIEEILADAQSSPSNSNTQPWTVHVVSDPKRRVISERMLEQFEAGRQSPDFTSGYGDGTYADRAGAHGATLYGALGIERADAERRLEVQRDNLRFYGAPHVAFLFMPMIGDGVRTASDIGMYAQTFLLSLEARGYNGIPQTMVGMYADDVRAVLEVPDDMKLLFGISFGTADPTEPVNDLRMHRLPVASTAVVHDGRSEAASSPPERQA
ncbi:nitroreductase [Rhodococcus sp. NBC_00294]|uniref:nitroreductase n=1 Tax=Rhodococcus sp. NBC_00294 TaxID=2976004 RepID=UPI002E28A368|nr:nitroreductase [Rhodococcus sp. NBC_00294]